MVSCVPGRPVVLALVDADHDQRASGVRVVVATLQQPGDRAERLVAATAHDESDGLAMPPRRGPARRLEHRHQLLVVEDRVGVEHPGTPPRCDVRVDRHLGLRGFLDHILTLPAE
jgi:hypothetical protein